MTILKVESVAGKVKLSEREWERVR